MVSPTQSAIAQVVVNPGTLASNPILNQIDALEIPKNSTAVLSVTGISESDIQISYIVETNTANCIISGGQLTANSSGGCSVIALIQKSGYISKYSNPIQIIVLNSFVGTPATGALSLKLSLPNASTQLILVRSLTLPDVIIYKVDPLNSTAICTVTDKLLSAISPGNCSIYAIVSKQGFKTFTTTALTVSVVAATIALAVDVDTHVVLYGNTNTLQIYANDSSVVQKVSYIVTESGNNAFCSTTDSGSQLKVSALGSCIVKAVISYANGKQETTSSFMVATQLPNITGGALHLDVTSVRFGSGVVAHLTRDLANIIDLTPTFDTTSACSVDQNGFITIISVGDCVITATYEKSGYQSLTKRIILKITPGDFGIIAINKVALKVGESATLTLNTIIPAWATLNYKLASISGVNACTLNGNILTAIASDVCIVSATISGPNYYNKSLKDLVVFIQ